MAAQNMDLQAVNLGGMAIVNSVSVKLEPTIEGPFIRLVYESIIKTFKGHKKFIEKELSAVVNKITQAKKSGSANGTAGALETIDQLIQKLKTLKTKYQKLIDAEDYLLQVMHQRLTHINHVIDQQGNPEVLKDYFSKRLNRIIIDFLLREEYFDTARKLIEETGLKDFVDIDMFEEISRILDKLKHRECKEALDWCNTHKTKLQKSKSQLEFKLRVQEFVELVKQNELLKAIDYSKKQLSKFDQEPELLQTISKILGVVAFREDRRLSNSNYRFYSDDKRWKELEELFLNESLQLYGQPTHSLMSQSLQTGIPILKMEFCMSDQSFKEQCPTCQKNIRKLGQKLPYSHHTQTCIECEVTGEMMSDQNQPVFLPSGYVVSERAIEKIQDAQGLKIVCPFTQQSYGKQEVKKVFFS